MTSAPSLIESFGLALLGGVVLNVMPCVLPVLTMKAFHIVEHSAQDPRERKLSGIAYTAGTMTLMIALATTAVLANVVLKRSVHWGSQFSSPYFMAAITALVFVFALNALGVFEITVSMAGGEEKKGLAGSYVNGLFAAIMATPCTAPFLGSAVAFALGAGTPWWQTEIIFALIGFGLALPYLLLTFMPKLGSKLPKPGPWMETCKQVMGFTLLLTAVWLFGSLQAQVTRESSTSYLFFLVFLAVALWAGGRFGGAAASTRRRWSVRIGQLVGIGLAGFTMLSFAKPEALACADTPAGKSLVANDVLENGHLRWTPYAVTRVATEHARRRPVFLDFTADWCGACKVNEKAFIETDLVRSAFADTGILPMKVDMTNDHPEGDVMVEKFGTGGIPIYVILLPDGSVDLLPQVITAELVAGRLRDASKRFPIEKFEPMATDRDRPPS